MAFEPSAEVFDEIAPHPEGVDPGDELIHERAYVVRAYRKGPDTLLLRGAVRDQKPPGLYIPEDPDPLTVHHMVVDLEVQVPSLQIVGAHVVIETHPHAACPRIEDHYGKLVELSIVRGFTHRVRELFGGPRGCTHTTALLQAMAPVALQSMWSLRVADVRQGGDGGSMNQTPFGSPEARERSLAMNLNTCHVWAEDGELVRTARAGGPMETPVWIQKRFEKLGIDPEQWHSR